MVRSGESGPGGTTATEKPMCKESCKEKGSVSWGVVRLGESGSGGAKATEKGGQIKGIWPWGTKPAERPICKESCKEKK